MPRLNRFKRSRNRRPPAPLVPKRIALSYYVGLRDVLGYARELVRERLLSELPSLVERSALKQDSGDSSLREDAMPPGKRVNRIMDRISELFYRRFTPKKLERLAERVGRATSEFQKAQLFREVRVATGVDLDKIADLNLTRRLQAFTAENVALIKSIPQAYFDDVEKGVIAGMREGVRHEDLAANVEERFGVSQSRAVLIARDQTNKFVANLSRARHQELGLTRYRWRTLDDNRVRDEHEELEGEIFEYAGGGHPEEGHPGDAVGCRCRDEPVFEDVFGDA